MIYFAFILILGTAGAIGNANGHVKAPGIAVQAPVDQDRRCEALDDGDARFYELDCEDAQWAADLEKETAYCEANYPDEVTECVQHRMD